MVVVEELYYEEAIQATTTSGKTIMKEMRNDEGGMKNCSKTLGVVERRLLFELSFRYFVCLHKMYFLSDAIYLMNWTDSEILDSPALTTTPLYIQLGAHLERKDHPHPPLFAAIVLRVANFSFQSFL